MAYMKKVSDSLSGNPSSGPGDGWFKISQDAYDGRMSQLYYTFTPTNNLYTEAWGVDRLVLLNLISRQ